MKLSIHRALQFVTVGVALMVTNSEARAQGQVRLGARLSGTAAAPRASGQTQFEARPDRRRFSTEVERLRPGLRLTVQVIRPGVGLVLQGVVGTNAIGVADLNLDTRRRQGVPMLRAGDVVQVFAGGTMVVTGVLVPR